MRVNVWERWMSWRFSHGTSGISDSGGCAPLEGFMHRCKAETHVTIKYARMIGRINDELDTMVRGRGCRGEKS